MGTLIKEVTSDSSYLGLKTLKSVICFSGFPKKAYKGSVFGNSMSYTHMGCENNMHPNLVTRQNLSIAQFVVKCSSCCVSEDMIIFHIFLLQNREDLDQVRQTSTRSTNTFNINPIEVVLYTVVVNLQQHTTV